MSCDRRCFEKDGDYAGFDACDICPGRDDGTSLEQRKREERLYRAAPELLEALKEMHDAFKWTSHCEAEDAANEMARAAIAQAESGDAPDNYTCPIHGQQDGQECPRC